MTSLRLFSVFGVLFKYVALIDWGASSRAHLGLTGLSCNLPRHPMKNADEY